MTIAAITPPGGAAVAIDQHTLSFESTCPPALEGRISSAEFAECVNRINTAGEDVRARVRRNRRVPCKFAGASLLLLVAIIALEIAGALPVEAIFFSLPAIVVAGLVLLFVWMAKESTLTALLCKAMREEANRINAGGAHWVVFAVTAPVSTRIASTTTTLLVQLRLRPGESAPPPNPLFALLAVHSHMLAEALQPTAHLAAPIAPSPQVLPAQALLALPHAEALAAIAAASPPSGGMAHDPPVNPTEDARSQQLSQLSALLQSGVLSRDAYDAAVKQVR